MIIIVIRNTSLPISTARYIINLYLKIPKGLPVGKKGLPK